jgi:hypothetical protein
MMEAYIFISVSEGSRMDGTIEVPDCVFVVQKLMPVDKSFL